MKEPPGEPPLVAVPAPEMPHELPPVVPLAAPPGPAVASLSVPAATTTDELPPAASLAAPALALASHKSAAPSAVVPSFGDEVAAAMPVALKLQLIDLESWALANRRDSRRDAIRFWSLKIPAMVVSAGSGIAAYIKPSVALVAGAVAGMCVLIDSLNPGGALRNTHLRAFNDLRILQERMKSQWQVGFLRHEDHELLAAKIIEGATKEKERINKAITDAEASLAVAIRPGKH
jgi:hypothetical protein